MREIITDREMERYTDLYARNVHNELSVKEYQEFKKLQNLMNKEFKSLSRPDATYDAAYLEGEDWLDDI